MQALKFSIAAAQWTYIILGYFFLLDCFGNRLAYTILQITLMKLSTELKFKKKYFVNNIWVVDPVSILRSVVYLQCVVVSYAKYIDTV